MAYIRPKVDYKDGDILYGSDLNASNEVIAAGVDDNFDRIQGLETNKQDKLIAGVGVEITEDNVINNTQTSAEWGNIQGDINEQVDLQEALDKKVNADELSSVAFSGEYQDIIGTPEIPTKLSDLENDMSFVNETALETKVDKEENKGLSTNDYTDEDKEKVANAITDVSDKQDVLVSGQNIKTINHINILGSGNIDIQGGGGGGDSSWGNISGNIQDQTDLQDALALKANNSDLSEVAKTGSYNDLDDKPEIPTIPTEISAFNNDVGYITSDALVDEVVISEEEPTGDDWKLYIDPNERYNSGTEVIDSLESDSPNFAPSIRSVNEGFASLEKIKVSPAEPTTGEEVWVEYENLASNTTWEQGAVNYDTGVDLSSTTRARTDYIEVESNKTYTINIKKGYRALVYEYNQQKAFSKRFSNDYVIAPLSISTTSNAKYIRIIIRKDDNTATLTAEDGKLANVFLFSNTAKINIKEDAGYEKLTDTISIGTEPNNAGLWVEASPNLFNPNIASIYTISNWTANQYNPTTNNTSITIDKNNILHGTANNYICVGAPLHYEANKTYRSIGTTAVFYKADRTAIQAGGTYTPTTSFDGYIAFMINSNLNVEGRFVGVVDKAYNLIDNEPYVNPSIKANINGEYETIYEKGWKLVGSASAKNAISLPSDFEQLKVITKFEDSAFKITLDREDIDNTHKYFYDGYYLYSSYYGGVAWEITSTSAKVALLYKGGADKASTGTTYVYYK